MAVCCNDNTLYTVIKNTLLKFNLAASFKMNLYEKC